MVYFDHNATSPLLPAARDAWLETSERLIGNPSSPHRVGARAAVALDDARERLAGFLGCSALDIVWTSGATESNNAVFHHLAQTTGDSEVWVSAVEHPCVIAAARRFFPGRHRFIPANRAGTANLDWLEEQLTKVRPALVAVMAANNETGVVQPWREALALCRGRGVAFFCDAVQWLGKLPARGLGECDWASGCAHKFGGPRGVGFLKCPDRGRVEPFIVGGQQEDGRRAGTENLAGVMAMVAALGVRESQLDRQEQLIRVGWRSAFEAALVKTLPGAEIVGAPADRLWNTVSALMPEADCQQRWVVKLDKLGLAVSTGSACSSGREEPSHVLAAMGYQPAEAARMLRFSSGWETTEADWNQLLASLRSVYAETTQLKPTQVAKPRRKTAR